MPEILEKCIYMADGERYRVNKNAYFSHVTICSKGIWKKTTEELQVTMDGCSPEAPRVDRSAAHHRKWRKGNGDVVQRKFNKGKKVVCLM